ncbi:hypothetical protein BN949_04163 [Agrobacterium tumefaciens]|nr:hypothetical protein BN949_04163 [Agrobacterium tumefaciens]
MYGWVVGWAEKCGHKLVLAQLIEEKMSGSAVKRVLESATASLFKEPRVFSMTWNLPTFQLDFRKSGQCPKRKVIA